MEESKARKTSHFRATDISLDSSFRRRLFAGKIYIFVADTLRFIYCVECFSGWSLFSVLFVFSSTKCGARRWSEVEKTRDVFAFSWCFLCAKCISRPRHFPGQSGRTCYGFLFNFILSETSKMFSYTQENSHTALSSATLPPKYLNHCVWEATLLCPMQKLFCNLVEFVFYTKKEQIWQKCMKNPGKKIQWTGKRWIWDSLSLERKNEHKSSRFGKWARRLAENVCNINENAWKRNTNLWKSLVIKIFMTPQ